MIIGLVGYKQSGKSTAAEYLAEKHGFVRHNFKDALGAEIKENFPELLEEILAVYSHYSSYTPDTLECVDDLFEIKPPLMRALMQNYGTDVRRKDNPTYWTDQWTANLPDGDVVADDVRFLNEAAAIWDEPDSIIIRIIKTDVTSGGSHLSETEQEAIKADYTVTVEPGDHDGLYKQLYEILHEIR